MMKNVMTKVLFEYVLKSKRETVRLITQSVELGDLLI